MKLMIMATLLMTLLMGSSTIANPISGSVPTCSSGPLTFFPTDETVNPPPAPLQGGANATCPTGDDVQADWVTSRAATCPWSYVTDYDADRFPASLSQAVCSCDSQGCLDPYTAQPRPDLQCTPVTYRVPVLRRRACVDGAFEIVRDYESVAVACACLRPVTRDIRPSDIIG